MRNVGIGAEPKDEARRESPGVPRWVVLLGVPLLIAFVLLVVFMVLPGGEHGPGRHSGGSTVETFVADAAEAVRTVEVSAFDTMSFTPGNMTVEAGEVVTFVVTNKGAVEHEFVLGNAAEQGDHSTEMGDVHGDDGSGLAVNPGETKSITWRFEGAGVVEYGCHLPGHYEGGMRGLITVRA